MRTGRNILIVSALLAIGGCYGMGLEGCFPGGPVGGEPTNILPGPSGAPAYFPLVVGNTWTYAGLDANSVPKEAKLNWTVVSKTRGTALVEVAVTGGGADTVEYRTDWPAVVAGDGFEEWSEGAIIQVPLVVGNNWQAACLSREIVATDSSLSTPAGEFRDVIVVKESPIYQGTCPINVVGWFELRYYARDVGLIKREYYILSGPEPLLSSTDVLVGYTVD
jgi:hypothetical protein